jgi:hypothetical protein
MNQPGEIASFPPCCFVQPWEKDRSISSPPIRNLTDYQEYRMQRLLIVAGLVLVAAGLFWPWLSRLPFGRLPGDISIVRDNFSFYFPITTGLLISLVLTIVIWLFRR